MGRFAQATSITRASRQERLQPEPNIPRRRGRFLLIDFELMKLLRPRVPMSGLRMTVAGEMNRVADALSRNGPAAFFFLSAGNTSTRTQFSGSWKSTAKDLFAIFAAKVDDTSDPLRRRCPLDETANYGPPRARFEAGSGRGQYLKKRSRSAPGGIGSPLV